MKLGHWVRSGDVALGAGLAGVLFTLRTMIFSAFTLVPGDAGDTRFVQLLLEYSLRWLTGHEGGRPYWDLPVFYPVKNTLAYSETLLGVAPLYWIWRVVGIGPDSSYAIWLILILALNFAASLLFFRRGLGMGILASTAGAWLIAFGSPRIAQLNHPQLAPIFWGMIALHALARQWRAPGPRPWIWPWVYGLAMALQFYSGFYSALFFALGSAILLLVALVLPKARRAFLAGLRAPAVWGSWLGAGVVSLLTLEPMAAHYLEAAHTVGVREYWVVEAWLPRIASWLFLGEPSWIYGWLSPLKAFQDLPMAHEQMIGIGLVTSALVILGFWRGWRVRASARTAGVTLAVLLVTSTYFPHVGSLWRIWYSVIPGVSALRSVSRIGIFLLIPAAYGLALWVESKPARWALAIGLGLVFLEQGRSVPSFDMPRARETITAIREEIESKNCSMFFADVVQAYEPPWKYQIDAMWAAVQTGIPTLNGYSGNFPANWGLYDITVRSVPQLDELRNASKQWSLEHGLDPAQVCQVTVRAK